MLFSLSNHGYIDKASVVDLNILQAIMVCTTKCFYLLGKDN